MAETPSKFDRQAAKKLRDFLWQEDQITQSQFNEAVSDWSEDFRILRNAHTEETIKTILIWFCNNSKHTTINAIVVSGDTFCSQFATIDKSYREWISETDDDIPKESEKVEGPFLNRLYGRDMAFIKFPHAFAEIFKCDGQALLMAHLCHQAYRLHADKHDGWFFCTVDNVTHFTGMSRRRQVTILNRLTKSGFIGIEKRGKPPRRWVWIDLQKLESKIDVLNSQKGTGNPKRTNGVD